MIYSLSYIFNIDFKITFINTRKPFFSKANLLNLKKKINPFECEFNPKFNARLPFTMRFINCYYFLIFYVELVLMFPFLIKLNYLKFFYFLIRIIIFTFILFLGLIHEWNQGSLDWVI